MRLCPHDPIRRGSSVRFDRVRALQLLRRGVGSPAAEFREGQEEAIRHVVEGRGRLLVVQRTGWGKSIVYFIAAKLLRERGHGPTLLISPLLALMRNQLAAAAPMGLSAVTINSSNVGEWDEAKRKILWNAVDILLISPERLANQDFRSNVLAPVSARVALLVVDEAHCISDWGHDFRPHYRLIERILRFLPRNLRVVGTTATANHRVMEDLREVLAPGLTVSRGDLSRPSLLLQTIDLPKQSERLAWLAQELPAIPGHGIVYTLTVRDAERVAGWLQSRGIRAKAYTGSTGDLRPQLEQALLENKVKALVATTALGMGFDKPDLGFVIHFQAPGSVVHYYQQVGRAGRALAAAYGVLLCGEEDRSITDHFISSAFPTPDEARAVLGALDRSDAGLSVNELCAKLNVRRDRIQKTVDLLSLESPAPIAKQGWKWQLTPARLGGSFWRRAERLTALRKAEQEEMREYAALASGHMEYLIRALDGETDGFTPPRLPVRRTEPEQGLVIAAERFLRRHSVLVKARKMWPAGGLPRLGVKGRINPMLQDGMALCMWNDAGWGRLVRDGKYADERFADELVDACVALLHSWNPDPRPRWVTCIPSRRRPDLVPDFSRRLAKSLGLQFRSALTQVADRPSQKDMKNNFKKALNVDGSLQVARYQLLRSPVLLVDDVVDSRWTLTVAAWLLRYRGCPQVWPLALAQASPR